MSVGEAGQVFVLRKKLSMLSYDLNAWPNLFDQVWSKAVDSEFNVQPESFENIWNLRGLISNAYSRANVPGR